jgi:hypothetical protein
MLGCVRLLAMSLLAGIQLFGDLAAKEAAVPSPVMGREENHQCETPTPNPVRKQGSAGLLSTLVLE